jgi:gliding motility-associated-like protein
VNEKLWNSISNQIVSAPVVSSISLLSKIIIGSSISAAAIVGGYYLNSTSENNEKQIKSQISVNKNELREVKEVKETISAIKQPSVSINKEEKSIASETIIADEKLVDIPVNNNLFISPNIITINQSTVVTNQNKNDQPINNTVAQSPTETPKATVVPSENKNISTEEKSVYKLDLKNVFTPNGDGVNDYLEIETEGLSDFSVVILDKNNQKVYTSNDPHFKWDGTNMSGEFVPEGSYIYFVTAKTESNKPISKYSSLTIKR